MAAIGKILLSIIVVISAFNFTFAQESEREKGIKLYQEGKNKEAIAALEKASKQSKTDADVWNTLGLAYLKEDSLKKAIKAFEKAVGLDQQKAVFHTNLAYAYLQNSKFDKAQSESSKAIKIDPKSALAYYVRGAANVYEGDDDEAIRDADQAMAVNPDYTLAYTLKSDALLYKFGRRVSGGAKPIEEVDLLQQAKDVLESCLKNCRNNPQIKLQEERLETLTVFHKYFSVNRDAVLNAVAENPTTATVDPLPVDPSITPMKVTLRPQPRYTDKARGDNISGTITIAAYFAESGRITHALILKGLGGGLNENALKAAYDIRFEPPTKDGKPFSQIKIVKYTFTIY